MGREGTTKNQLIKPKYKLRNFGTNDTYLKTL